jgi:dolichyl-diphosphooligosaccharide--protein glycosyltransferase
VTDRPFDSGRTRRLSGWLLVSLVLGAAVRLIPWKATFAADRTRFWIDTDPHYHVLRARRIIEWGFARSWFDPNMNYPEGARIVWPPLFDLMVAVPARVLGGAHPPAVVFERVAAILPVVLGLVSILLVAALGKELAGGSVGGIAALFVAVLPASLRYGAVGCADQHIAELVISCWLFLAFVRSWREGDSDDGIPWKSIFSMSLALVAAFWNWPGSSLYLMVIAGATSIWFVAAPPGDPTSLRMARSLALAGGFGALLLALSILIAAPRGDLLRGDIAGVGGLAVSCSALASVFGAVLLASGRGLAARKRAVRLAGLAAAGAFSAGPLMLLPSFRAGLMHGLAALVRGNAWYGAIQEFKPRLFSGAEPLAAELQDTTGLLGFGFFLVPAALFLIFRRGRSMRDRRGRLSFLAFWTVLFFVAALLRIRFMLYVVPPLAIVCGILAEEAGPAIGRRFPARARVASAVGGPAVAVLLLAPTIPIAVSPSFLVQPSYFDSDLVPLLRDLRSLVPSDPGRPAVMADWDLGHMIQYYAEKPVVVTPFGTEAGADAMSDWGRFLFTTNEQVAEAVLERRRAGFVLLREPDRASVDGYGFAPAGTPRPIVSYRNWRTGESATFTPLFWSLVASRLYNFNGVSSDGSSALGAFRLIAESPTSLPRGRTGVYDAAFKAFGVVRGARLAVSGARPGASLFAAAEVTTNQRRSFSFTNSAITDSQGRATLRLPYATGRNGLVQASPWAVSDGEHTAIISISEEQVTRGSDVFLAMTPGAPSR